MKVNHRISFNLKGRSRALKKFNRLGIKTWAIEDMRFFDITEDDPRWPRVSKIIKAKRIPKCTWTKFTKEEILSAEWIKLASDYNYGFPMPKGDGSWKKVSFNCENFCPECGIGLKQKTPIHLEGEPDLKNNDFMAIYWTYNFFARPEVLDTMLENNIQGFEILPAINHSTNTPLETVKQMKVTNELPSYIVEEELKRDNNKCEHIKYWVLTRGMLKFHKSSFVNLPDLIRTYEWFGTGHEAIKLTLASAKFVRLYYENNWKGLFLAPIELI